MAAGKFSKGTWGAWLNKNVPGEPLPGETRKRQRSELRALLARHGIDADPFIRWLGQALSDYRFAECVREQMPARADVRDAMRELRKHIRELHRSLNRTPARRESRPAGSSWY